MAQRRLISKTLGSSRKFHTLLGKAGKLGQFAQTLYPLLVVSADDFGRFDGDAFTIKCSVFPSHPAPERDFESAILAMHEVGLIHLYSIDGNRYLEIMNFDREQTGLHKRTKSRYPNPPEVPEVPGNSGNIQEIPASRARAESKRNLKGRESNCSEPSPMASKPETIKPHITIPTNTGVEFPILQEQVDEFAKCYPAVDVHACLLAMRAWSISNPKKRKTEGGMMKFINGWLAREQNNGNTHPLPTKTEEPSEKVEWRENAEGKLVAHVVPIKRE